MKQEDHNTPPAKNLSILLRRLTNKRYVGSMAAPLAKLKCHGLYRLIGYCHNLVTSLGKGGTPF